MNYQQLLSMSPRPDPRRPVILFLLATERFHRHTLSNQREDLDMAIVHFTESILLQPLLQLRHAGPFIRPVFVKLAAALVLRSGVSKQPEDAIYAAKYLFYLRDQPHEIFRIPRYKVTELLVGALALKVELEAGSVAQSIREMAVLSRELLTLDTSDVDVTNLIILIHAAVQSKIRLVAPDQPLDELIDFLRAARQPRPDLLEGRIALAHCLVSRYSMTSVNDDYEEAVSILDETITNSSPGNSQDESVVKAQATATRLVTALAMMRSKFYQTPEYLEEAISRARTSSRYKEYDPSIVVDPEVTAEQRFQYFGFIEGVEASSGHMLSPPVPEMMEVLQTQNKMKDLLLEIRHNDDITKLEVDEIIEKGRSILASSSPQSPLLPILALFGDILYEAFRLTNKIEYLNGLINARRQLVESSTIPQAVRFIIFPLLSKALLDRFMFFPRYRTQDLDEGLELLSLSVINTHASLHDRFWYACQWASIARRHRHTTVSTAYKTALSLMQDTPLFSPTLPLQHATLAMHVITQILPLDYASYLVDQDELEEAIETLERGRALLWSEMRHLRVSLDQLLQADPDLAHKFAAVNLDLEELIKSVSPSHKLSMDTDAADGLKAADPFGRLVLKQRGLLTERTKLTSHFQALPGFDGFRKSPSSDTLSSAASSGPVIIINHSEWRSDILILLHNKPPSLITTPPDFYSSAIALKDKLLDSRPKSALDTNWEPYENALTSVLKELYELVGKFVIDRLSQLHVPEQSGTRIWWLPTSVFCSLPLHAMGPIPSEDGEIRYFSDLYTCSYTPTLSALIQSRDHNSGLQSSDRPSILLVAQLDEDIQVIQALDTKVTSLIDADATPAAVIDGLHSHRFVHFACHGKLETGKPFEAGFELHDGVRLTVLEIVRSRLPTAEFAFLSACHTAEVTEGSVTDEGLHLAAAIQYCGFRSVVGTMWAMADTDGPDLARYFYKALFSGPKGMPHHERSAKALGSAVKKLRRKRGIKRESWVNFVHYGA